MRLAVDASVVIKWLFADPAHEDDTELATNLMSAVVQGQMTAIQPFHWLAEVAAVIARETPSRAEQDVELLHDLQLQVCDGPDILRRACRLAIALNHHLFDTLYRAVALETDAILVTADERYRAKAQTAGQIVHLRDWLPAG
jgi:predicted nucleic acid-binding protein